jgi:hypothetical protein
MSKNLLNKLPNEISRMIYSYIYCDVIKDIEQFIYLSEWIHTSNYKKYLYHNEILDIVLNNDFPNYFKLNYKIDHFNICRNLYITDALYRDAIYKFYRDVVHRDYSNDDDDDDDFIIDEDNEDNDSSSDEDD